MFSTQEQLDRFRPDLLAARNASLFTGPPRLVLTGENLWGSLIAPPSGTSHTAQYHPLLGALGVAHVYDDAVPAPHNWNATWATHALEVVLGDEGRVVSDFSDRLRQRSLARSA